jgi:hypothetical protein
VDRINVASALEETSYGFDVVAGLYASFFFERRRAHEVSNAYTYMREMLRSDLDGDGYGDILIFRYASAVAGTFGHGFDPLPLARHGPKNIFSCTEIVPAPVSSTQPDVD